MRAFQGTRPDNGAFLELFVIFIFEKTPKLIIVTLIASKLYWFVIKSF